MSAAAPLPGARPDRGALRLRPMVVDDEGAVVAGHRAMVDDDFDFALGYRDGMDWSTYLDRLAAHRRGEDLPDGWVPSTFLVADVDGEVVGRTSVRHELNAFLAREGGHIGYGVLSGHRGRGYATEILRQSLVVARAEGIGRVLVTCDVDNVGSATVIERCGGVYESTVPSSRGGPPKRRFWID